MGAPTLTDPVDAGPRAGTDPGRAARSPKRGGLAALRFDPHGGFFWELVTLIDVMLLGHWIEMRSVRQASGALEELAKLMPDTAERLLPDGRTEVVPTSQLRTGELVLVRPGATIPVDGEVIEGESDVNEAMITGESTPVKKRPGDRVIAGAINDDGSLGAPRWEFDVTGLAAPNEFTSIEFDSKGRMVLAQRGATTGAYDYSTLTQVASSVCGFGPGKNVVATAVCRVCTSKASEPRSATNSPAAWKS